MRVVALAVVAILAAAIFVVPEPGQQVPGPPAPAAPAGYTVCPLVESARRTTVLDVLGGGAGEVDANVFAGGAIAADTTVQLPEEGSAAVEVSELTGIALAPVLIGFDDPSRRVQTSLTGAGIGSTSCAPASPEPQLFLGGDSVEGTVYTLLLSNPFAGSATVDLLAASEVGVETDPGLEGIVVPPRSIVPVELSSLLPGRQLMSVAVVTRSGRVVAGAKHESGSDFSAVSGIQASSDWYLPFPQIEGAYGTLALYNPSGSEVPFQLDVYGPDEVFEAAHEDVIPARSQVVLAARDFLEGPGVLRVVATAPLGAVARFAGEAGEAVFPGVATPGPSWLLPGAGRHGASQAYMFNAGVGEATARLVAPDGQEIATETVPSGAMVAVDLPAGSGASVEADSEIVVVWMTVGDGVLAADAGRQPNE